VICGTSGVFPFGANTYRDTDWYVLPLAEGATVTIGIEAEFSALLGFVDMEAMVLMEYTMPPTCTYATVSHVYAEAGDAVIFVSTDAWDLSFDCGSDYYLTIDGCPIVAVEEASWGSIKALYR